MEDNFTQNSGKNEEIGSEVNQLRPAVWSDYIGQDNVKKNLGIILEAAKKRGEPPDHLLFYGQAGLGKTTLAYLVANELGVNLKVTSGPAMEKMGDLAAILTNLEPNEVLFIDEVHRLNKMIEEVLYPAMESRKLHLVIGKGPGARTLAIDLQPFTLVAATTRVSLLSAPLRSRFGATFKLDYYSEEDIKKILRRSAKIMRMDVDDGGIAVLSSASRATPRIANRLLRRVRDYAEVNDVHLIDEKVARSTMEMLEIDGMGLEPADRRLLEVIIGKFNGGPVGVGTLSAALSEDRGTIEDVYEPYLMNIGFLQRTSGGRVVTEAAREHLKMKSQSALL